MAQIANGNMTVETLVYKNSVYHTKWQEKTSMVSLSGDFEDISLRDSPQANSTVPTSPSYYFSDVSSTRGSSRDSSTSVTSEVELDTEDTSRDSSGFLKEDPELNKKAGSYLQDAHYTHSHSLSYSTANQYATTHLSSFSHSLAGHSNSTPTITHKPLMRHKSIGLLNSNYGPYMSKDPLYNPNLRRASTGNLVTRVSPPGSRAPLNSPSNTLSQRSLQQRLSKKTLLLRKALSTNQLPQGLNLDMSAAPLTTKAAGPFGAGAVPPLEVEFALKPRNRSLSRRISREQLEMQYDADEADDDLADGVNVLWNVPLSPALYAKSRSSAESSSQRTKSSPNLSVHSSLSMSPEVATLPCIKESEIADHFSAAGLEQLGPDARDLTRAFQSLSPDISMNSSTFSPDSHIKSNKSFPNRRHSDLGQTLSKEKIDVLSRTRPSWLPPKSKEEERRHLQQHKQLLEQLAIADKKREEKRRSDEKIRSKQRAKDEKEWMSRVMKHVNNLEAYKKAISEPCIRELWWRGIPVKFREQIWKAQIGNNLNISAQDYRSYLAQALSLKNSPLYNTIKMDVDRTFPELQIFGSESGPLHEDLINLLLAYSVYRKDVGYKPALCSIGAIFLLSMSPADAFIGFANSLETSLSLMMILKRDDQTVTSYYTSFLKVLNTKFPTLYQHFQSIQLPPSAYLEPVLASRFTQHLRVDVINRVWDIMMFEGDAFLLRAALGTISIVEHRLYGSSAEVLQELGWNAPVLEVGDEDVFIKRVRDALKAK